VTALQVFQGVVCYLVLALMLYLLVRTPRNVLLRVVTVMVACWGTAYAFGLAAGSGHPVLGLEPIMARLIQHLCYLTTAFSLLSFFLFAALDARAARRQARWQAVPLVVAALVMTIATAFIPHDIRNSAAALPSGPVDGPVGSTPVALLYLTVNLYLLYAFATTLLWTRRYARGAEPRLRRGLAVASAGLVAIVLAIGTFVIANVVRWLGGTMPHTLLLSGIALILVGVPVFLAGMVYPAVGMRLAALRIWWQHRQAYHQLDPLWTLLHAEFPGDALRVPTSPWRDALSLRGVHRRYYRRVIECRDGLVRVSPYLGTTGTLADQVREGLRAHATAGPVVPVRATAVAMPARDGLEADVHELVTLSQGLRASSPEPAGRKVVELGRGQV
jgi:hypothetical protein